MKKRPNYNYVDSKSAQKKHASTNPLTCSAPQVTPFILEIWSQKRQGRPKNNFKKIFKKLSRTTDVMVPKNQKYNL